MDLGIKTFITAHKEESRGGKSPLWPLNSSSTCSEFLSALPPEWYSSGSLDEYSISRCYIHVVANWWLSLTGKETLPSGPPAGLHLIGQNHPSKPKGPPWLAESNQTWLLGCGLSRSLSQRWVPAGVLGVLQGLMSPPAPWKWDSMSELPGLSPPALDLCRWVSFSPCQCSPEHPGIPGANLCPWVSGAHACFSCYPHFTRNDLCSPAVSVLSPGSTSVVCEHLSDRWGASPGSPWIIPGDLKICEGSCGPVHHGLRWWALE